MPNVRIACCVLRRAQEPVCVRHRLFRYRYSLSEQENRFRPTDIRVSGVTALQRLGSRSRFSGQHSACGVKARLKLGISATHWPFLRDVKLILPVLYYRSSCLHSLVMPESKPFERLPKTVVPEHYNLQLKPNLKTFIFEGQETIKVEVRLMLSMFLI